MKKILFALLLICSLGTQAQAAGDLYVYIWSEYLPDAVVQQFEQETGTKVTIATYDSNEAMYAKVKMLTGGGYDIIVPSSDFVARMRKEGLLESLDKAQIPNASGLTALVADKSYDPGNAYSMPYMWGSTAIGVNTDKVPEGGITSFADLWDPRFKDRLILPNDPRGVFGMALKKLGYSLNSTNRDEIIQAYEELKKLFPSVRVFDSDSPKQAFLNEEVDAGTLWNGEAYMAHEENPAIDYIYPTEGYSLWVDSLCIPKGAKNVQAAHAFIDFLLRPEISAAISEEMGYASPVKAAKEHLSPELQANEIVYPTDEELARGEFEDDLGDAVSLYEEYWNLLKAGF